MASLCSKLAYWIQCDYACSSISYSLAERSLETSFSEFVHFDLHKGHRPDTSVSIDAYLGRDYKLRLSIYPRRICYLLIVDIRRSSFMLLLNAQSLSRSPSCFD